MFKRKKGFLPMLLLSLFLLIASFMTLIPFDQAEAVNLLGYRSLNAFTPFSTLLFLTGSIAVNILRKKYFLSIA